MSADNKKIFQKAYLVEVDKMVKPENRPDAKQQRAAGEAALKQTPFYEARVKRHYNVSLEPYTTWETILYGEPPQLREVPQSIDVKATKI